MRDEKDGGSSRVLRCEARLATALVGVKSVDFFLYSFSFFLCSVFPFRAKRRANLGAGHSEPVVNMSSNCLEQNRKCSLCSSFLPHMYSFGCC